jgi:hypothetical protein
VRKLSAETYAKKIASDSALSLLQHRSRCESVAMAQSEFQRFFVALHIIFDYAKSVRGHPLASKTRNELEVTLAVTLPAGEGDAGGKGGKDKGKEKDAKKGKDANLGPVPFREPIAPVLVSRGTMEQIPEVNGADEVVDPKAKKAPAKVKKNMSDLIAYLLSIVQLNCSAGVLILIGLFCVKLICLNTLMLRIIGQKRCRIRGSGSVQRNRKGHIRGS